jgi:hypothetical protein
VYLMRHANGLCLKHSRKRFEPYRVPFSQLVAALALASQATGSSTPRVPVDAKDCHQRSRLASPIRLREEILKHRTLAFDYGVQSALAREPRSAIRFRECHQLPRFGRPDHREAVAAQRLRVAIALQRPYGKLLLLFCRKVPRASNSPSAAKPVSSWNSRLAAWSGSSSGPMTPFGIDHAPKSFFGPDRPAHMDQQDLQFGANTIEQDACTFDGHATTLGEFWSDRPYFRDVAKIQLAR